MYSLYLFIYSLNLLFGNYNIYLTNYIRNYLLRYFTYINKRIFIY